MNPINIEVAFASKSHYKLIPLQVPMGTTLRDAIYLSGILALFPEINLSQDQIPLNQVGIFGELKDLETILQENDRVEIYRALPQSAMVLRKTKAQKIKKLPNKKDRS